MHYSLKKLPAEAKFIKIIFGNIGGTPWSPCIESIELKEHNTDEVGFETVCQQNIIIQQLN